MRELKFRAWDDVEKRMYYGNTEQFDDMLGFRFQHFETDKPVYMQYTGLKDKNGKEIYEGDIVRAVKPGEYIPNRDDGGGIIDYVYRKPEERIFIVEYFGATFAIKEVPKSDKYHAPLDWIVEDENIEIIGNIFENPELLKGEENA